MFARVYSAQPFLLKVKIISIETDLSKGLNSFNIVGLPDKAVEEARDRVSASIKNCGLESPKQTNQKTLISLAPADLKKEGPLFDVGIALSYLLARGDLGFKSDKKLFIGELSLDGMLRPVHGILPIAEEAKRKGFSELFVPYENAKEASLISGIKVFAVKNLADLIEHLKLETENKTPLLNPEPKTEIELENEDEDDIDFSDIKGQAHAKRGLEIAASGGHNIAMFGPPGTGKTLLAKAFRGILPPLSFEDALEVTSIHSVAGTLPPSQFIITKPPIRSPHHTSSHIAIIGGGAIPKPGEITLAHKGILFMDEFPEFDRRVIETLRQPLEDRKVSISRAKGSVSFPAHITLIATLNPCPCGNFGSKDKRCICTPQNIVKYQRKISGPIMDRIDMWLELQNIDYKLFGDTQQNGEKSAIIKERVGNAREKQKKRFKNRKVEMNLNSAIPPQKINELIPVSKEVREIIDQYAEKFSMSPRSYHKVIKLARTIADLEDSNTIEMPHALEALQYRPKEMS